LAPFHHVGHDVPEEAHGRHLRRAAHGELRIEQRGLRPERNQIDAERPVRRRAHGGDLTLDHFRRFPNHAEQAESAGFRNGDRQLGARRAAHSGRHHGVPATEQTRQRSIEQRGVVVHGGPLIVSRGGNAQDCAACRIESASTAVSLE
jgi:hypothetical protein